MIRKDFWKVVVLSVLVVTLGFKIEEGISVGAAARPLSDQELRSICGRTESLFCEPYPDCDGANVPCNTGMADALCERGGEEGRRCNSGAREWFNPEQCGTTSSTFRPCYSLVGVTNVKCFQELKCYCTYDSLRSPAWQCEQDGAYDVTTDTIPITDADNCLYETTQ